jgi:hypothetical protein
MLELLHNKMRVKAKNVQPGPEIKIFLIMKAKNIQEYPRISKNIQEYPKNIQPGPQIMVFLIMPLLHAEHFNTKYLHKAAPVLRKKASRSVEEFAPAASRVVRPAYQVQLIMCKRNLQPIRFN